MLLSSKLLTPRAARGSGTRVSDSCREEESPGARAPKFVGTLKVVPKLVASDQKIGRLWMLVLSSRT